MCQQEKVHKFTRGRICLVLGRAVIRPFFSFYGWIIWQRTLWLFFSCPTITVTPRGAVKAGAAGAERQVLPLLIHFLFACFRNFSYLPLKVNLRTTHWGHPLSCPVRVWLRQWIFLASLCMLHLELLQRYWVYIGYGQVMVLLILRQKSVVNKQIEGNGDSEETCCLAGAMSDLESSPPTHSSASSHDPSGEITSCQKIPE